MAHQTPKPSDKPAPPREKTPNGSSQRQSPTEANEHGPGHQQGEHPDIPDPRDSGRDPPGKMDFPGPNPDEPAKQLSGGQSSPSDETPEPELRGDPDQPRIKAGTPRT